MSIRNMIRDVVAQPRTPPPAQTRTHVNTWMTTEIKAWLEKKGTTNALCGTTAVNYGFDHSTDCSTCRRLSAALLNEAIGNSNP